MGLVFPVLLVYYIVFKDRVRHGAALMGIAIVLVGLLLTKVRGEYIALLISVVMVVSVSYFRGWLSSTQTFKVAASGIGGTDFGLSFCCSEAPYRGLGRGPTSAHAHGNKHV